MSLLTGSLLVTCWGLVSLCVYALLREIRYSHSSSDIGNIPFEGNSRISFALYRMSWGIPVGLVAHLCIFISSLELSGDEVDDWLDLTAAILIIFSLTWAFFSIAFNIGLSEIRSRALIAEAEKDK